MVPFPGPCSGKVFCPAHVGKVKRSQIKPLVNLVHMPQRILQKLFHADLHKIFGGNGIPDSKIPFHHIIVELHNPLPVESLRNSLQLDPREDRMTEEVERFNHLAWVSVDEYEFC